MRRIRPLRRFFRRPANNWPVKIAAVVAAGVLWWVASNDAVTTIQRSLLVDLEVVGVDEDEVPVGVPARVEVIVTGPSDRMDALQASDIDAELDVTGVDGPFERLIDARAPRDLRVVGVIPTEVIGRLEAVRSASFAVLPMVQSPSGDLSWTLRLVSPVDAIVEARDPVLARVDSVFAVIATDASDLVPGQTMTMQVPLVAVDADGRPVEETTVLPAVATVEIEIQVRLERRLVPVRVRPPPEGVSVGALTPDALTITGLASTLADVTDVVASVPELTQSLPPGVYAVPLELALGEGISVSQAVVAELTVLETETPATSP